jgi:hypothetical protein
MTDQGLFFIKEDAWRNVKNSANPISVEEIMNWVLEGRLRVEMESGGFSKPVIKDGHVELIPA